VRLGARDYDPVTGRWTAKDPVGFGGGDVDLYLYTQGDPINGLDQRGRLPGGRLGKFILRKLAKKLGGKIAEFADLVEPEIAYPPEKQEMDKDTDGDGRSDYWDDDDDNDSIPDDRDPNPKRKEPEYYQQPSDDGDGSSNGCKGK